MPSKFTLPSIPDGFQCYWHNQNIPPEIFGQKSSILSRNNGVSGYTGPSNHVWLNRHVGENIYIDWWLSLVGSNWIFRQDNVAIHNGWFDKSPGHGEYRGSFGPSNVNPIENASEWIARASIKMDVNSKQRVIFVKTSLPLVIKFKPAFCRRLYRSSQSEFFKLFTKTAMQRTTEMPCWAFPTVWGRIVNLWPASI